MDDSDSIFSDNSDAKTFTDEFFNNIPEDSDEEECSIETIDNSSDDLTLEVGMTFFTWKSAYDYIKRWSLQQGFFIRQGRCVKVENERRKQTIAFTKPMLDDIEWMCIYGHLKPLSIKRMLKAKYNRKIYNQDLYKVIYKHRKNNPQLGNNDVSQLFVYLETLKEKDPRWIIYKDWDHETNTLTRIFWMSPEQLETWHHYSDVILNDNTAKTNRQNLPLRLKSKLGELFDQFKKDFYECRNSLVEEIFEQKWSDLLVKYPNTASYLERSLYPSKKSWACAFNNNIFTIDIQTTSRCESVNATFKRLLFNSNSTLIDIFHAVQERLEEEEDNNDYINWKSSLPCNQSSTIASNAFTNIIDELKLFVTPQIQKVHYSEMEMAFNYDARVLDQSYIKNETSQDWSFADGFIENQEIRQITFPSAFINV
ncbi:unnamed protein product [Rhizophagus irregularis]|nr:unnamed protein product [Rhizophagus irregularis]